jgi:GMP synthase (glutamine-hydrolysing)
MALSSQARETLVLQHVPNEHGGTILDFMKREGIAFRTIRLDLGEATPSGLDRARAVVIMGGPMNVDEDAKFPFLAKEKEFLKKAIDRRVPCLGVCLGAQLLACALGAPVYKAKEPEVGWGKVELTPACVKDGLFSAVEAQELQVLQWHEDTFDLPKGAERLASSAAVPNQAFRHGDRVYGLQFHLEVNEPMLKDWFARSKDLGAILGEYARYRPELQRITGALYRGFFSLS